MANYTYLLRCADGTLYCGWTNDVPARVAAHNGGRGAKYTRSRRPVVLVYAERCEDRRAALSREWHIKRMTRAQKLGLIKAYEDSGHDLPAEDRLGAQPEGEANDRKEPAGEAEA